MEFSTYTLAADSALFRFIKSTLDENNQDVNIIGKRLSLCEYHVHLVSQEDLIMERLGTVKDIENEIRILHNEWQLIGKGGKDSIDQEIAWKRIDSIGEIVTTKKAVASPVLRRFRNSLKTKHFFLLLTGKEIAGLPNYELFYLSNLWQIEKKALPIHTSGVVHNSRLFLFGGPSGAGKSTVAFLSGKQGDCVLDEDQMLLTPQSKGLYQAQAWGYSLQTTNVPITAVLRLVKDNEDLLIPLSKPQTSRFLLERILDVMGFMLERKHIGQAFLQTAELARTIPGYELHFRKSPDFWKLIDSEFKLD